MQHLWSELIGRLDCGVMVFDGEARLLFANAWLQDRAGRPLDAGRTLTDIWPELGEGTRLTDALGEAVRLGFTSTLSPGLHSRLLPLCAPGQSEPLPGARQHIVIRPLRQSDQARALMQVYDVTLMMERESLLRRRERELAAATEAARVGSEVKSRFMADMSHELRTPMNAILGFADALKQGLFDQLTPRQADAVEHVQAAGGHLLTLLNELLDLSKIEAGRWEFEVAPVEMLGLTDSVARMLSPLAAQKTVMLTTRSTLTNPFWQGCQRSLRQILINLVGNALKYTPEFGRVSVLLQDGPLGPSIEITDTGIGMTASQLSRLGEAFTQFADDPNLRSNGVGLGLSICKALIDRMGGHIGYTSTPGVGTVVTVSLPARLTLAEPAASA